MENVVETQVTVPKRLVSSNNRNACLVQIYPTASGVGTRHVLDDKPVLIGRDQTCDICIDDPSVSREHTRLKPSLDGHYCIDMKSTNGTFVNDRPASMSKLKDGDYIRVGNWIYRYLAGGNIEAEYHEEIYRLTIIDALTGVYNKRYLLEFLDRELARSARYKRPLAIVMMDLDRFKSINDTHGHLGGDYVLREFAGIVRGAIKKEDLFARYGGEEFAVALPETEPSQAFEVAEKLRGLVESHHFEFDGKKLAITVSAGVANTIADPSMTSAEFLRRSDEKLYEAKHTGRNRVIG